MAALVDIRSMFKKKHAQVFLLFFVAAFLVCCVGAYMGNIVSTQRTLDNLAEQLPVTVRVVNRTGSAVSGLAIDTAHHDALVGGGVTEVRCTSHAAGAWSESARQQEPFLGGDTPIVATDCRDALVGVKNMTFGGGWDEELLSGGDPLCLISEDYASLTGLEIGDELSLCLYSMQNTDYNVIYRNAGEVELRIVGTFSGAETSSVWVPEAWLRRVVENAGQPFYFDSLNAVVERPFELNGFKDHLRRSAFMETIDDAEDWTVGDAVSVEDEMFIQTACRLRQNLQTYRNFLAPFFGLVTLIVVSAVFLILRSERKNMAIAISLGQSNISIGLSRFLAVLLIDAAGCVAALIVLFFAAGISLGDCLLICGLFLLCSAVGTAAALFILLRFDALSLLTKVD